SRGATIFGYTWTPLTADLPRSDPPPARCFLSLLKQNRKGSIDKNGFMFRAIAAASCIMILKQPVQRSLTRRNTLASSDKRPTKLLHFGITDRSCRAAFVHSKSGCC